ncbi:MAG: NAD(P)-dependent oxidoreductase [Patescibacteria group bacterium]
MKIIIFGAKGNLGTQLVYIFNATNKVIAWDKEGVDITNESLILQKINDNKPDIVINATGYNAVDKCENNQKEYEIALKLNRDFVRYLAKASVINKAVFVNYSSDYVFSGDKKNGYEENDLQAPINKYGETKLMGEREILGYKKGELKYYLIRTSKLFGPKGESKLAKPSFFDLMLELSRKRDIIKAVDEEVSCFTYTPDLAKATLDLVNNKKPFGIYHITNSGPCTWHGAAKELFKIANVNIKAIPITSKNFPRPAKRPKYSVLLNTKLKPLRDWKEALKEYLPKPINL